MHCIYQILISRPDDSRRETISTFHMVKLCQNSKNQFEKLYVGCGISAIIFKTNASTHLFHQQGKAPVR